MSKENQEEEEKRKKNQGGKKREDGQQFDRKMTLPLPTDTPMPQPKKKVIQLSKQKNSTINLIKKLLDSSSQNYESKMCHRACSCLLHETCFSLSSFLIFPFFFFLPPHTQNIYLLPPSPHSNLTQILPFLHKFHQFPSQILIPNINFTPFHPFPLLLSPLVSFSKTLTSIVEIEGGRENYLIWKQVKAIQKLEEQLVDHGSSSLATPFLPCFCPPPKPY